MLETDSQTVQWVEETGNQTPARGGSTQLTIDKTALHTFSNDTLLSLYYTLPLELGTPVESLENVYFLI